MVDVRVFGRLSLAAINVASQNRSSSLILKDNLIESGGFLVYLLPLVLIHGCGNWCFHIAQESVNVSECAVNLLSEFFLVIDSKPSLNGSYHIWL
jgi:hypothetical protein